MASRNNSRNAADNDVESTEDVLIKHREKLAKKVADIEKRWGPILDKIDRIQVKIDELKAQQWSLAEEKREIEVELVPARQQLARVARASGGRGLGDNPTA